MNIEAKLASDSRIRSRMAANSASYNEMQQNAMNIGAKLGSYNKIWSRIAAESASYSRIRSRRGAKSGLHIAQQGAEWHHNRLHTPRYIKMQ